MRRSSRTWPAALALGLLIGLVVGALWHWLYVFPFPLLSRLTAGNVPTQDSQDTRAHRRWRLARGHLNDNTLTEDQKRAIERLRSIGYVDGSMPAPTDTDVTVHEEDLAYGSLNLVVSAHAPEALLMDMSGKVLHKWECDIFRVWPDFDPVEHFGDHKTKNHTFWRRAHVLENGDLLAIFEGVGLVKLDRHSNILWSSQNGAHHDLYVTRGGDIYLLTREARLTEYNPEEPILEDYISVLDSEGKALRRLSILEALENSPFTAAIRRLEPSGDILHTNTIELIEELPRRRASPFRIGTVLISIRKPSLVCAVDMDERTVYWAESDYWHRQHQPTLLENGNMLVFDNESLKNFSIVLEFDPIRRSRTWAYVGGQDGYFYSKACGSCQRLPNGNTLITESDRGRAFEVTPDKTIVWEYVNPHRAGDQDELVASLFEVVRLSREFPVDWISADE